MRSAQLVFVRCVVVLRVCFWRCGPFVNANAAEFAAFRGNSFASSWASRSRCCRGLLAVGRRRAFIFAIGRTRASRVAGVSERNTRWVTTRAKVFAQRRCGDVYRSRWWRRRGRFLNAPRAVGGLIRMRHLLKLNIQTANHQNLNFPGNNFKKIKFLCL